MLKKESNFLCDQEGYDGDAIEVEVDIDNSVENTQSGSIESRVKESEDSSEEEVDESPVVHKLSLGSLDLDIDLDLTEEEVEDSFTPEERLQYFADKVMSGCVGNKEIKDFALGRVMSISSPRLFSNENYILFSVFYAYRGRLKRINIDSEFLKLFLNRNRGLLEKSRGFIDINAYGEIDGSVELGYIGGVLKHFKRLESMEDMSEIEFETIFEKYLIEYKALETSKVYSQAQVILSDGMQIGRKKYFGQEDSVNYVKRSLADIEGIVNVNQGTGFSTASELLMEEQTMSKSYKISDFDQLEELNRDDRLGGIFTSMFYQVIAPPKGGKSKLCARVVHTTAVKYGNNVSVWAKEGGKEAFLAQLRAIHFDYIYNTGASVTERKYGVSQDVILHDKFVSDELRQLESSSKIDFACNSDYGSVDFIDRPFEVETFLLDIETSVKANNSKLLVIDYLQLIDSATGISERERVSTAYKTLLDFCKKNNIAVFTPGQYKQETIDRLVASGTEGVELRTGGGNSSEVIRTPDIIFALWSSTQDLMNGSMKILPIPSRFCRPFPAIDVAVDMETCNFVSLN